jgi:S1-C subfamily serine protease
VVLREVSVAARELGVRRGDLLVEVNDTAVATPMDFYEAVLDTPRGRPVRLRLLRQDQEKTVEVPWEMPSPPSPSGEQQRFRV